MESMKNRKYRSQEANQRAKRGYITINLTQGLVSKKTKKEWLREAFNQLSPTLRSSQNYNIAKVIIKKHIMVALLK